MKYTLLATALACGFLSGCAPTINQGPFSTFQTSLTTAGSASESAAATIATEQQNLSIDAIAQNDAEPNTDISFTGIGTGTMAAQYDNARAMHTQAMVAALASYNASIQKYASLLAQLASPAQSGTATLDADAASLQQESVKVANDLKTNFKVTVPDAAQASGIISSVFLKGVETYVKQKQAKALVSLIKANSYQVEQYSVAGQNLTAVAKHYCQLEYDYENKQQKTAFKAAVSKDPNILFGQAWKLSSYSQRVSYTKNQYTLDASILAQVKSLNSLYSLFEALPKAHDDLAASIQTPGANLTGLTDLYTQAKQLVDLYNSTQKAASSTSSAQPAAPASPAASPAQSPAATQPGASPKPEKPKDT